jgi:hypothetical protein
MIIQEQQRQGAELLKTLAQKAWESSSFKEQLVKNPGPIIESITGENLPLNTKIIVEDQTDESVVYFNIPRKMDMDELELTDEQLEMVAGGTDLITGIIVGVIVVGGGYLIGRALR